MSEDLPQWFERDLTAPFRAGVSHVFLLHGDVHGLFPNPDGDGYLSLQAFFEKIFDTGSTVVFYDVASGMRFVRGAISDSGDPIATARATLQAKRDPPRTPDACLPLMEKALRTKTGVAVMISSAHFVAPMVSPGIPLPLEERANIQRLLNWAQDAAVKTNKNIVLLVTDQAAKVSQELRLQGCGVTQVSIPKPTEAERSAFLRSVGVTDPPLLSRASQGLSLKQLEEALKRGGNDPIALKEKKREILNAEYGDVMEVVEPVRGLTDIGGLEHIKRYFAEVLDAVRKGDPLLVPMGVTLMGPPGTGKTAIVEALAKEAGFNFVKTKNVRSMWIGESEARMEKVVYGLRSLAPVVVMNDEADLAEGRRDTSLDSGVSERLMKMWMELLADPQIRGKIIVINCTNRPDRIDAALKRSGRSDERILLPMPSFAERAAISGVLFRRHGIPTSITDFSPFAQATDGLSGADLERIVLSSYRVAKERGVERVDDSVLAAAANDFIPSASQADIDMMTIQGLAESSSRRLLPPNVQELVEAIAARKLVKDMDQVLGWLASRDIITLPSGEDRTEN